MVAVKVAVVDMGTCSFKSRVFAVLMLASQEIDRDFLLASRTNPRSLLNLDQDMTPVW
jgi:hypothetical protein